MGKMRDLFKKIRDTKGKFHAKMGSIKERNGKVLTEAEDIKNLYAGQETTVRIGHGTIDWFQIGKGVRQGVCILSPRLVNLYAEYIMTNAGLEEA